LRTVVAVLICAALMFAAPAFAVDGVVLINQSTVLAAGGFPYKITQPGSYKLSGNLVVSAADTDGIFVNSSNVTLDLNGFTISGPVTCGGSGASISCTSSSGAGVATIGANDFTIRNGSVIGFQVGVSVQGQGGDGGLVEEIHATRNAQAGILVFNGLVRRNSASFNGFRGMYTINSTVTENVANLNGIYGLQATGGVYGSNTFEGNGSTPPVSNTSAVSQNNNGCNGIVC
jgi:hypothetical protein